MKSKTVLKTTKIGNNSNFIESFGVIRSKDGCVIYTPDVKNVEYPDVFLE